jgi:regulatory protein
MAEDAYTAALRMLAVRELSERQVRQRLSRRGHDDDAIEAAVTRLKADKSIDDTRVAGAIARSETSIRKRGRLRVERRIEAAGISPSLALRAVDEVFADIDPDSLLAAALDKRLHGREYIEDEREFQRLYRFLSSQGFETDRILRALKERRRR